MKTPGGLRLTNKHEHHISINNKKATKMHNQNTVEKMRQLRLHGMGRIHATHLTDNLYADYTIDQYTALLTDTECEERNNRKIERLFKTAGFRMAASLNDVDYRANRGLDRNLFERLGQLNFISNKENVIITGPTGSGKSYLAQALGNQACQMTLKTLYTNTSRIFSKLKLAKLDGSYLKELQKIERFDLLILDDFGLQAAFDNHAREALMDIIEDRYNRSSTIVSSQIPVSKWHEIIGEGTIADAILDRLIHSSHRITLKGESMRKNQANK
jgi:DNA replication protein DnaC